MNNVDTRTDSQQARDMLPAFEKLNLPTPVARELRSDHAGETGAVWIYKGILAVTRDRQLRDFAEHHLETEQRHLEFFENWLPARWQTRLTLPWKIAGWTLGALPALLGRRAVFTTIRAVESFVDKHYAAQVELLDCNPHWSPLRDRLQAFRDEEIAHRDDAAARLSAHRTGLGTRLWTGIIASGSAAGVIAARRI